MLDIIGFWGSVTVLTALFLAPIIFWVVPPLIRHFVSSITGDEYKGREVCNKVVDWGYSTVDLFGYTIREWIVITSSIIGMMMWGFVGLTIVIPTEPNGTETAFDSYADFIAQLSAILVPYVGEISLFAIMYFLGIFLSKKAYKTYTKVEAVLKKVNNEAE